MKKKPKKSTVKKRTYDYKPPELDQPDIVFKAKVMFFDRRDGEGIIQGLPGEAYEGNFHIFACNIPGKKTWFSHTACVYYKKGTIVDVKLTQVGSDWFCVGFIPGIFDEAKWNQLHHDSLAFRCDENGNAITGLFK